MCEICVRCEYDVFNNSAAHQTNVIRNLCDGFLSRLSLYLHDKIHVLIAMFEMRKGAET